MIAPRFQKRHFEFVAISVYNIKPLIKSQKTFITMVKLLARELRTTNGRFDEHKFVEACLTGKL